MNPIVIIPARMASARLPGKPLAMVGGVPMVVQVMRRAASAGGMQVLVACDGEEIAAAVRDAGGEAVVTDAALPSGSDRIFQALQKIDPAGKHDIIINVQGDMPTLDPRIINEVLQVFSRQNADIATLAAEITDQGELTDSAVVKVAIAGLGEGASGNSGMALYFSRSLVPHGAGAHYHHIGIYAYKRAALEKFISLPPSPLETREKLEQLRALEAGMKIAIAVVDATPLGVDTPEGLEKARSFFK